MYLVAIGWLYVALMMAAAEAMHPAGSVLGAVITFLLYGAAPTALVIYVMGTPMRRRARRQRELDSAAAVPGTPIPGDSAPDVVQPDQGSHAPGLSITPIGKEP